MAGSVHQGKLQGFRGLQGCSGFMKDQLCATCEHWKSEKHMTPLGLANCKFLPAWTFKPANQHCPKWSLAANAEARVAWLQKRGLLLSEAERDAAKRGRSE